MASSGPADSAPRGSASRTSSASASSLVTGPESRSIPTCAPCVVCHAMPVRGGCTDPKCPTSMSSAAGSPAKTSATPARAQGSTGRARVFGQSTPVSLASFDLDTSSWRTSQLSLLGGSEPFSQTWPRSGMTRSGTAYRLQPLAPLTGGIASGLLPTPAATMADKGGRGDLLQAVRGNPSPSGHFKCLTPLARDWKGPGCEDDLPTYAQRVPTPTVGDSKSAANRTAGRKDPDSKHHSGTTLTDFVRLWPTPKASPSGPDFARMNREGSGGDDLATAVARTTGGALNPTWVEWLMGFPLGWTDCGPSETPSSRRSRSGSAGASSTTKKDG